MKRVKIIAIVASILSVTSAFAESDNHLYNSLNNARVPVPLPANGALSEMAQEAANVPCLEPSSIRKLEMNQNRFLGQCDFETKLKISGLIKVSTGVANNVIGLSNGGLGDDHHILTFMAQTKQVSNLNIDTMNDLFVERAVLNVDDVLSDWAELHVGILYWNNLNIFKNAQTTWFSRYQGTFQGNGNNVPIDEANVVISNFSKTPFYFRIGRQYLDFGWYDKTESLPPMTQWFSQSQHDAVTIGILDFYNFNVSGSIFRSVSRGHVESNANTSAMNRPFDSINNFSASIGYGFDYNEFSLDLKGDYMFDMFGVDFFDGYLGNGIVGGIPTDFDPVDGTRTTVRPKKHVGMAMFSMQTRYKDLDFKFQYVSALHAMEKDLWTNGGLRNSNFIDTNVLGVRPHAWGMELGFSIPVLGRDSRLSAGYYRTEQAFAGQTSDDRQSAQGLVRGYYIPRKRALMAFEHNLMKNVDTKLTFIYDNDYTNDTWGSINNRSSNAVQGSSFRNTRGTRNHNDMLLFSVTGRFN